MPSKKGPKKENTFSWAKGNGTLTDLSRGIVFGMHLSRVGAPDIACQMQVRANVLQSYSGPYDPPTRAQSEIQAAITERQDLVEELMVFCWLRFCSSRKAQGTMDHERYIEILQQFLIPKLDLDRHIFMQDGARPHKAKATIDMLTSAGVRLVEWPAKSPAVRMCSVSRFKSKTDPVMRTFNTLGAPGGTTPSSASW